MARPVAQPRSRRERRSQQRAERSRGVAKQAPSWRSPVALTTMAAVLVGLVVIVLAGGLSLGGAGSKAVITPETSYEALATNASTVGSASAPVTMTIYSDFQCPICKRFLTTELPSLLREFVAPGTLRIESRDIDVVDRAGGSESLNLAIGGACAAEQNAYWPYHDLVFWNQGRENSGYHDSAFIDRMAAAAGLDLAAFDTCRAGSSVRQAVLRATSAAAGDGIAATPTIEVNGQRFVGLPDYDQLGALIRELASPSAS